jgi:chromosome segregation ATPase
MALRERLNKIISQLTGDNAEALKTELREAITEAETITESLMQANNESKTRKEKIRALETELSDTKEKVEGFTNLNPELERLKKVEAEFNTHKQTIFDSKLNTWKSKAEIFAVPETDKRFAKVVKIKDQFTFPADDKSQLTAEQIDANLKAFNMLEIAGYFDGVDNDTKPLPRPKDNSPVPKDRQTAGQALFTTTIK